ncbi:hypothetical protein RF11_03950 [Thelohanellus kitauei]|uniref:Uncharacterized protein n=1 Tax=Thelohanellus kitauei TaxID=669202 RepID=A0A0C2J2D8_THEKT|nr:hypothetical protein RF11_03950 [Thelohanellus kitauei]
MKTDYTFSAIIVPSSDHSHFFHPNDHQIRAIISEMRSMVSSTTWSIKSSASALLPEYHIIQRIRTQERYPYTIPKNPASLNVPTEYHIPHPWQHFLLANLTEPII